MHRKDCYRWERAVLNRPGLRLSLSRPAIPLTRPMKIGPLTMMVPPTMVTPTNPSYHRRFNSQIFRNRVGHRYGPQIGGVTARDL